MKHLVRLMAAEKNPHQLIAKVAADARLLREAERLYRKRHQAGWSERPRLERLCGRHRLPARFFAEHLRLIVYTLNLGGQEQDYYEILNVGRNADRNEIKGAFRSLSMEWHPDKNSLPEAAERFQEIRRAYEVLGNERLRRHYDRYLAMPTGLYETSWAPRERVTDGPRRRSRRVLRVGLAAAALMALVFLVGHEDWLSLQYIRLKLLVMEWTRYWTQDY
jgi:hypothetical protein